MFSGEWGGIRGIPDGWREREPAEISQRIDELIGDGFRVAEYEEDVKEVRTQLQDLKGDISMYLAAIEIRAMGKAGEYRQQLEALDLGIPIADHINQRLPKSHMSRDTEALRQGTLLASWLYYEAVAIEATKTVEWFAEYRKLIQRLTHTLTEVLPKQGVLAPRSDSITHGLHPTVGEKCLSLFQNGAHAEAVEKSFKTVRDRLRQLTGFERGADAFGKGKLHIAGAAAPHVDGDFNEAVKFLTMAIDMFRNEKSHTSDARIEDSVRAYQYLVLSSLALHLLDQASVRP